MFFILDRLSKTSNLLNVLKTQSFGLHQADLGTNSTRFHVEITIINFIYYYYLTIGGLGFGGLSLRVLGVIGGFYVHTLV